MMPNSPNSSERANTQDGLTPVRLAPPRPDANAELALAAVPVILLGGILVVAAAAKIAAYLACKNKTGAFVDVTTRPPTVTPSEALEGGTVVILYEGENKEVLTCQDLDSLIEKLASGIKGGSGE